MITKFFRKSREDETAPELYCRLVEQARTPAFYRDFGIPDSLDGRFELIVLHLFLLLHRLKQSHPRGAALGQALHDRFFDDMDRSLREMGAGDLGVGKKVKRMAEACHGRIDGYDRALAAGREELERAVTRNLYGTCENPAASWVTAIADYVERSAASLAASTLEQVQAGQVGFAALPGTENGAVDRRGDVAE